MGETSQLMSARPSCADLFEHSAKNDVYRRIDEMWASLQHLNEQLAGDRCSRDRSFAELVGETVLHVKDTSARMSLELKKCHAEIARLSGMVNVALAKATPS